MSMFPGPHSGAKPKQIVLWVNAVLFSIQACLFFRFLHRVNTRSTTSGKKISEIQKRMNLGVYILTLTYTSMDWTHAYGGMKTGGWLFPTGYTSVCMLLADSFYFAANVCIYSILLQRLHATFSNSEYKVSRKSLTFIGSVLCVQTCGFIGFLSLVTQCEVGSRNKNMNNDRRHHCEVVIGAISGFTTVCDYILNGLLLYLFISKLRALLVNMALSDLSNLRNPRTKRLLYAICKQNILGLSLLIFGQLFFTLQFVLNMVSSERRKAARFFAIMYVGRSVEGVYNMILLDLSFSYADTLYHALCRKCHDCMFHYHFNATRDAVVCVFNLRNSVASYQRGLLEDLKQANPSDLKTPDAWDKMKMASITMKTSMLYSTDTQSARFLAMEPMSPMSALAPTSSSMEH